MIVANPTAAVNTTGHAPERRDRQSTTTHQLGARSTAVAGAGTHAPASPGGAVDLLGETGAADAAAAVRRSAMVGRRQAHRPPKIQVLARYSRVTAHGPPPGIHGDGARRRVRKTSAPSPGRVHMGATGSGQLTKMVNQICIAGVLQGLSEGLHFAEQAGLDVLAVVDVISKGAAQSWQMENRSPTMAQRKFDFGFAVDWMRKDLAITLQEARKIGAKLPVGALVDQFYAEIQAMGGRRWDTSSLIARLERD